MARNLYRFYLYTVFIALLIFAAIALGRLLGTLLLLLPFLRASYDQAHFIQSLVFVLVSWLIVGLLGGLHYWLIRRDIHSEPAAGSSAIRSFFLNVAEAIGIGISVPFIGGVVLSPLAHGEYYSVVEGLAFSLPILAFVGLLELERRRTQVTTGAALAFQHLHLYGVQLLLLIFLCFSWQSSVNELIDGIFFAGRGANEYCRSSGYCQSSNLPLLSLNILWFLLFWLAYGWLARNNISRLLRSILHLSSLAVGVGILLFGFYRGFLFLLLPAFKIPFTLKDVVGPSAQYDFAPFVLLGVLIISVYHLWLTMAVKRGLVERKVVFATEISIAAILTAFLFWSGCAFLLHNAFRTGSRAAPEAQIWATNIAMIIVGCIYIPLDLYLRRRNSIDSGMFAGARRGFVLAVLGVGILYLAIGGAVALYAWATVLLGSPIPDWLQTTHTGLAAFIIGGIVTTLYLMTALRERLFNGFTRRNVTNVPVPVVVVPTISVESLLDELLAGNISRDEAAHRIHELDNREVSTNKIN